MVEMNQFGNAQPGSAQTCTRCESLLMDVLDGAATAEDQQFFDAHVASCTGCSQMLADARRGGAWLEMLRDPRPQPPAALFERILAQTSGLTAGTEKLPGTVVEMTPRPIQAACDRLPPPDRASHPPEGSPFPDARHHAQHWPNDVAAPSRYDSGDGVFLDRPHDEPYGSPRQRSARQRSSTFEPPPSVLRGERPRRAVLR